MCDVCVSFVSQSLNELINIIINAGVVGGCADLCHLLPGRIESTVCDLLCDVVGIEGFIKLLQDADPDPIWICEELKTCPVNDNWGANITDLDVSPESGEQGTTFDIDIVFAITDDTSGTGELVVNILPPQGEPFGTGNLLVDVAPGSYQAQLQLEANPSEQEPFSPGQYNVTVAICNGGCGSSHSNAALLAIDSTSFSITE